MAQRHIDINPASFLTIGTIGPPGQRTFFLQASQGSRVISLIIEKEHARALAVAIDRALEELAIEHPPDPSEPEFLDTNMSLLEPVRPAFRVGQMGLGYDEQADRLVIVAEELLPSSEDEEQLRPPVIARIWGSRTQMRTLSRHAKGVVAAGRPTCPMCGRPMDPDGHFCPRRNGHQQGFRA